MMLGGFSEGFEHYLTASDIQVSDTIRRGMVVVDTNVLLDAYRFAPEARAELFGALEALGDRLWVPHQVALEFHKNRAGVIAEHDAAYAEVASEIREIRESCDTDFTGKVKALAKRIALKDSEADRIIQAVSNGLNAAARQLGDLRDQHGITTGGIRDDAVLAKLQEVLSGKVGRRPDPEEDESARTEAARRMKDKIPPGFQDRRKGDPYGDYLLWRQALTEAKSRKIPLLIVTRDVKDDWFWRVNGRTIGARPELVRECTDDAGVGLIIMTTQSFLHHSVRELNTNVSDDTLRQADELPPPGVESITVLHPKTSTPQRVELSQELFDFIERESEKLLHQRERKREQLSARLAATSKMIAQGETAGGDLQKLQEESNVLSREMENVEEGIRSSAEIVDWCRNGAGFADAPRGFKGAQRSHLELYAGWYLEEQES